MAPLRGATTHLDPHILSSEESSEEAPTGPRLLTNLLVLAFLGLWFITLAPTVIDGPAGYTEVSGHSMDGTYKTGDLILTQSHDTYAKGDIIVYDAGPGQVIHRIIGGNGATGYTTQGDNNPDPDPWHPTDDDVVGQAWHRFEGKAWILHLPRQPWFAGVSAGLLTLLVLGWDARPRRRDDVDPAEDTTSDGTSVEPRVLIPLQRSDSAVDDETAPPRRSRRLTAVDSRRHLPGRADRWSSESRIPARRCGVRGGGTAHGPGDRAPGRLRRAVPRLCGTDPDLEDHARAPRSPRRDLGRRAPIRALRRPRRLTSTPATRTRQTRRQGTLAPADDQGHAGDQGGHSQAPSDDQDSSDPASGSSNHPATMPAQLLLMTVPRACQRSRRTSPFPDPARHLAFTSRWSTSRSIGDMARRKLIWHIGLAQAPRDVIAANLEQHRETIEESGVRLVATADDARLATHEILRTHRAAALAASGRRALGPDL